MDKLPKNIEKILNFGYYHGVTDLCPTNNRKSFYGKAKVHDNRGNHILQSYGTMVAIVTAKGKFVKLWDGWSATSGCHIASFADSFLNGTKIGKGVWDRLISGKQYDREYIAAMADNKKMVG